MYNYQTETFQQQDCSTGYTINIVCQYPGTVQPQRRHHLRIKTTLE